MASRPFVNSALSLFLFLPFFSFSRVLAMFTFFLTLALLARRSTAGVSLSLYTDQSCTTPSATNPNVTLGLNVCAVTTGLESFILLPTPCVSGDVAAWMFTDIACGNPAGIMDWYHGAGGNDYCWATFHGAMAAVMLTCDANKDETYPSRPTSTTTIAVGPVANPPASATTSTGSSSSGTSTSESGSTATGNSTATGWSSLDLGTRIGIIVAICVGVPPIIIGFLLVKHSGTIPAGRPAKDASFLLSSDDCAIHPKNVWNCLDENLD
ncbi:hypothetical protein NA56DRAFT_755500 [Hyaloscypha hepaticicola]|uniref:Uncharacterized protein n=1 Tax=Hyaloscypha hepaticicola TaxID=2082293 RepID=A0A2J6PIC4_9HELO|nr:hypothetical protein NA56DRAFT_755500 [Hyaloscypha hepaticicola]